MKGKKHSLYLSEIIKTRYPEINNSLLRISEPAALKIKHIKNTKDIWARDYMPVKVNDKRFVSFKYNPDYLKPEKYQALKNSFKDLEIKINGELIYSDLIVDGGNIEKYNRTGFMVDKVFDENPEYSASEIEKEIRRILDLDHLYFIPRDKSDIFGHIDGMLRFYNERTVLINNYKKDLNRNNRNLKAFLNSSGFEVIELPYNPYSNKTNIDATGIYINYILINNKAIMPSFGINEDKYAFALLQDLYGKDNVFQIFCGELAREGGLLNCISWH
jgi:agmatine deiminase